MTRERLSQISERTLMPLSMVLVVIGFTAWLTRLSYATSANTAAIEELKASQAEYTKIVQEINVHLANIDGKMNK